MNRQSQGAILEAACRDAELLAQVPPVVAAGFGVLPLRRQGDVLTVACLPRANRQALRLLRDVLELEIVATPFEERPLYDALRKAYEFGRETVNFPTFREPGFLEEPTSARILGQEKVERPAAARCELAPGSLVLAVFSYHSTLTNLDAPRHGPALPDPERTRVELGKLGTGWSRRGGAAHVYSCPEALPEDVPLVLTQFRHTEYRHLHGGARVSEHEVLSEHVSAAALPFVIHPTEVQLTGLDAEGAVHLHVYDRDQRFVPGEPGRTALTYHFLSYGSRLRRTIDLLVHELVVVDRNDVEVHAGEAPWGPTEFSRWLGLSEPAGVLE